MLYGEGADMYCRINDLKSKYVINVRNGGKLGYVSDVEIDTVTAMVASIIIKGRLRMFGILGREDDIIIRWSDIEVIGEDTILVNHTLPPYDAPKKQGGFFNILTED
ncbi:YlmC/YmxH family sporulation protein [Oscillospiraceae bacterium PP1C4]